MPHGHGINGVNYDPLRAFKFLLNLITPDGREVRIGCTRISGLRAETEIVECYGAIAVSGRIPSDDDEYMANIGLKAIQDHIWPS